MNKVKQLLRLNLDDFWLYLAILGIPFLVLQFITFGVMFFGNPASTVLLSGVILAVMLAIVGWVAAFSHSCLCFGQYVQYGCTRKRALTLALSVAGLEVAAATLLALLLPILERTVCVPICRVLSGHVSLLVDVDLAVPWWVYPLAALGGMAVGLLSGSVMLRFGAKGGWVLYALFMLFCLSFNHLPWVTHTVVDWLIPLAVVLLLASTVWSIYTLLHITIKG